MELRTLAAPALCDLEVSVVGLGCNSFGARCDAAETRAVVHKALDCGINFFDTANSYGGDGTSEDYMGRALEGRRHEFVLATKFGYFQTRKTGGGGGGRDLILDAVEASLRRLRTDYIDLYQHHLPDPDTPIEETLAALDGLVRSGKVRFIGCSNLSGAEMGAAMAVSADQGFAPFATAQNQYNLLDRHIEADLMPVCQKHGIGIIPYRPLASGLLTGKYRRGKPPPPDARISAGNLAGADFDTVEALQTFAADHGHTLAELAMSWLAAQPCVTSVIAGVRTPDQVEMNAKAADWKLSGDELPEITRLIDD